ncbi:hypothetical protein BGW36DRAFT_396030 [Talaromyces proteolyticus]|uniref:protein-histidine N-methyltransferase n=1 Tax=Talaromyces proteolyticus TaxID=1131652 RepID=A0AAD4KUH1_9EURO|nr:uncharacterized protein BGW36DRAFT_396030 [Talaromyces proteolyticus]KAH8701112.1 hypothetical protein BGW36DRAFT_396030 [Talaromyces proteolyticus]
MASMFSFGFSGDDIEDDIDINIDSAEVHYNTTSTILPDLFPAEKHLFEEWASSLPSQIAYNTLKLENPESTEQPLRLGRRELFDVRTQLMAEDAPGHEELVSGLEQGDLKPTFYEGGFKTWECALDLARLVAMEQHLQYLDANVLNEDERKEERGLHVVEMGCGTAVPSLALFARLLRANDGKSVRFTLADYNSTVLRMVSLPNLLLTWWLNTTHGEMDEKPDEGELDIDATLLDAFRADVLQRGIVVDFVSGAWSPELTALVLNDSTATDTLVLASETIYSPSSLGAFSETLMCILRRAGKSRSLVAAKKVYFGVGGGIDEFLSVLHQQPLQAGERVDVQRRREISSEGVGRIVLEVSIHDTTETK